MLRRGAERRCAALKGRLGVLGDGELEGADRKEFVPGCTRRV